MLAPFPNPASCRRAIAADHVQKYGTFTSLAVFNRLCKSFWLGGMIWVGLALGGNQFGSSATPVFLTSYFSSPAQAAPTLAPRQQGSRILLSGSAVPPPASSAEAEPVGGVPEVARWGIWEDQVAVEAGWLRQRLGVELLPTDNPAQQPVRWQGQTFTLAAYWDQPVRQRFLAIAPLLQARQWQAQPQGDQLQLVTTGLPLVVGSPGPLPAPLAWYPGITLRRQTASLGGQTVAIAIIEIQPSLFNGTTPPRLRPFWANPGQLTGLRDTGSAAFLQGAAVAINGGYFNRNTQQPLGAIRQEGAWISGPILGRGVMAWDDQLNLLFTRLRFQEELRTDQGQTLALTDLNSAFLRGGFARYTAAWGATYTNQTDNEIVMAVQNDQIQAIYPTGAAGSFGLPLPQTGYLLIARLSPATSQAQQLQVGDRLTGTTRLDPVTVADFPHALGGGPLLIQAGQIVLDAEWEQFRPPFPTQRAARSAVGQTADGRLLLVTAGQRQENIGLTLAEMAQVMQQLGSTHALNLDGGTSSTLYLGGELVNLSGPPPRVHNSLGLFFPQP